MIDATDCPSLRHSMNLGAKAALRTSQGFRLDGTLLSPRRAGVGADRRAVDQQLLPVGIAHDASL